MKNKINFLKIILFSFFNNFGSAIFTFSINLYILQRTGSAFAFSLGMVILPLVNIFFLPISGHIIDNYNHLKIMRCGLKMALITLFLTLLSLPLITKHLFVLILLLLLLLFILRTCDTLVQSSLLIFLPAKFTNRDLQKVNSLNQSIEKVSGILGPVFSGVLFYLVPFIFIGWIEFTFDFFALLVLHGFSTQRKIKIFKKSKKNKENQITFHKAFSVILHSHLILSYLSLCIISNIAISCFEIGIPFIMLEKNNYSSAEYGFVDAMFSVGALIVGLIISIINKRFQIKDSFRAFNFIGFGMLFLSFAILIIKYHIFALTIITLSSMIIGGGAILANITMITNLQIKSDSKIQGHIFTLFDTIVTCTLPIFSIIFGFIFQQGNSTLPFILTGVTPFILTMFWAHKTKFTYNVK